MSADGTETMSITKFVEVDEVTRSLGAACETLKDEVLERARYSFRRRDLL